MSRLMMMGCGPSGPGAISTFYSQRVFDLFPQLATANSGWSTHTALGSNIFGSGLSTDSANDSDYIEWTVHVPGGNYKVNAGYVGGPAGGKTDLTANGGSVIGTIDTYTGAYNAKWLSDEFALTEGSNTIRFTKNGKNAASSAYVIHFYQIQLIKQDATSALTSVANVPHIIDVPVVFADSHTNWNTLSMSTASHFGTGLISSGAQNAAVTFSFWAPKGAATLCLDRLQSTNNGIYSVDVDGVSWGTTDGYNASPAQNVTDTSISGTITSTGTHTITFTMATKNASSSSYIGNIHHIQIRMTSITEPLAADLAPEVALFWPVFNEGNTTWSTATVSGSQAYYYYYVSGGAQNSEITLSTNTVLRPGTYRLDLLVVTLSSIGKYHVLVDTVDLGNYDGYSVGTVNNVVGTIGSLALTGYTPHTIKLKMSDKNASSSNYVGRLTLARLIRTGS